jgi:hypothetical protein
MQKMEIPKQTRPKKLKVLEKPSEVCAFVCLFAVLGFELRSYTLSP